MPSIRQSIFKLAFVVIAPLALQAAPQLDWARSVDFDEQVDSGFIVASDAAGSVFAVAATRLSTGTEDVKIIKYDAAGVEQWTATYSGPVPDAYDLPVDAVTDAAGDLYITAVSTTDQPQLTTEWATFKLSGADGSQLWERRLFGPGTFGFSVPRDMAIGSDGRIAVAGWTRDDLRFADFGVAVYAPDGGVLWERHFSSPGAEPDSGEAVAVGADGSVAVVGRYIQNGDTVVGVVKYAANGDQQWWATFDATSAPSVEDRTISVAIDALGHVYVAADGINVTANGRDFVLLKYGPAGNLLWDRRVASTTGDITPLVRLGPAGTVYLSGASDAGHRVVAFDADGNQLWNVRRAGRITDDTARTHAVIDADGQLTLLLRTTPIPGFSAFTIARYGPDGTLVDESTIAPEGVTRWPVALAGDAQGNLYATGWTQPQDHRDVQVYKLSLGSPLPGDVDGDGDVDVTDLGLLLQAFGACSGDPAFLSSADFNGNDCVDIGDLGIALLNFGA